MKYLISGASSAFCQAIAEELVLQGNNVSMIGRTTKIPFYLENPEQCLEQLLDSSDYFLHFAHSFDSQTKPDLNEIAARKILAITKKSHVKKCIYISSESASPYTKSSYGQSKYRTERIFLPSKKWVVIRIGVIENETIPSPYQLVSKLVKLTRVLIIPNPYRPNLTVTNVNQVARSVVYACRSKLTGGPFSVQRSSELISIVDLLQKKGINPKLVLRVPDVVAFSLWSIGKRIRRTRRISDSIMSTVAKREVISGIQI